MAFEEHLTLGCVPFWGHKVVLKPQRFLFFFNVYKDKKKQKKTKKTLVANTFFFQRMSHYRTSVPFWEQQATSY